MRSTYPVPVVDLETKPSLLYHFIQFGSHVSRAPSKYRNVTVVTAPKVDLPNFFPMTDLYAQIFAASGGKLPKIFAVSRPLWASAETKISVGPSRVTMPAELNEIVQYCHWRHELRSLGVAYSAKEP